MVYDRLLSLERFVEMLRRLMTRDEARLAALEQSLTKAWSGSGGGGGGGGLVPVLPPPAGVAAGTAASPTSSTATFLVNSGAGLTAGSVTGTVYNPYTTAIPASCQVATAYNFNGFWYYATWNC